jgi:hypothetical protein
VRGLDSTMRLNQAAQLLKGATIEERVEWAIEMRKKGNELYEKGKYADAMQTYLEVWCTSQHEAKQGRSLTGAFLVRHALSLLQSLMGLAEDAPGANTLKVPTVCNMAACALKMQVRRSLIRARLTTLSDQF